MRILIEMATPPPPRARISGITGGCGKPTLNSTAPISTPPLSQMRSCMSIAPRLTKPPGAGLTLSCRSLQGARELPKHSKLPTP